MRAESEREQRPTPIRLGTLFPGQPCVFMLLVRDPPKRSRPPLDQVVGVRVPAPQLGSQSQIGHARGVHAPRGGHRGEHWRLNCKSGACVDQAARQDREARAPGRPGEDSAPLGTATGSLTDSSPGCSVVLRSVEGGTCAVVWVDVWCGWLRCRRCSQVPRVRRSAPVRQMPVARRMRWCARSCI